MAASDLVLLCSGTVTLQAAFMNIPMIIMYRLSGLTSLASSYLLRKGILSSNVMGLPLEVVVPRLEALGVARRAGAE